jgi:hypothetical protein
LFYLFLASSIDYFVDYRKMDPLPPDDPNNNDRRREKEVPHDGSGRQGSDVNANGEMDIIGDMREQPIVVAMFLMGLASWYLRSHCTC